MRQLGNMAGRPEFQPPDSRGGGRQSMKIFEESLDLVGFEPTTFPASRNTLRAFSPSCLGQILGRSVSFPAFQLFFPVPRL